MSWGSLLLFFVETFMNGCFFFPLGAGVEEAFTCVGSTWQCMAVQATLCHQDSSGVGFCLLNHLPMSEGSFGTKTVRGIPAIYTSLVFLGGGARLLSVSLLIFSVLRHKKSGFISIKSIYLLIHFKQLSFISSTSIF